VVPHKYPFPFSAVAIFPRWYPGCHRSADFNNDGSPDVAAIVATGSGSKVTVLLTDRAALSLVTVLRSERDQCGRDGKPVATAAGQIDANNAIDLVIAVRVACPCSTTMGQEHSL